MKDKYNVIELSILSFLLLNGFSSTIIIKIFKDYNILEIITSLSISMIIGYPIICFILNRKNNKLLPILIICSSIIAIFSIINTSQLIQEVLSPNLNINIIILLFIMISYFLSSKGLKSIVIASNLLFFIYLVVILSIIILNINNFTIPELKINKINILCPLIYSTTPLLYLSIIPKKNINNYKKYKESIKKIYIIYYIYLIIKLMFLNLFKINFLNILIINILIENFILIALSIYYISYRINNKKYNIIIPLMLFIICINLFNLNNIILLISNSIFILIHLLFGKRKETNFH